MNKKRISGTVFAVVLAVSVWGCGVPGSKTAESSRSPAASSSARASTEASTEASSTASGSASDKDRTLADPMARMENIRADCGKL